MRGKTAVVWWFGLAGVLWLAREGIGVFDPAYYDPETALDYSAAWLTSIAGGATAVTLIIWFRHTPIGRGSWLLVVAAIGFGLSAAGNVIEDVFDLSIGGDLYMAGFVGFGATVAAGLLAVTVSHPLRWSGLFLVGYAAGFSLPDNGGLLLAGVSLLGMAFWYVRQQTT